MLEVFVKVVAFAALMAAIVYAGLACRRYEREYPLEDIEDDGNDF